MGFKMSTVKDGGHLYPVYLIYMLGSRVKAVVGFFWRKIVSGQRHFSPRLYFKLCLMSHTKCVFKFERSFPLRLYLFIYGTTPLSTMHCYIQLALIMSKQLNVYIFVIFLVTIKTNNYKEQWINYEWNNNR